jgi:hypothetical protein
VCVAYVGVSRHRCSLTLVNPPGMFGIDYPFPHAGRAVLRPAQ